MMSNSSSTTLNYQLAFWNHIWSLQVPAKVRSLLWRASTSSLPTLLALRSKNVDVSVMCPVCNGSPEDILHALVKCSHARSVWCQSSLRDLSGSVDSFGGWWQQVMKRQRSQGACMSGMIVWSIWNNRNDLVWNGSRKPNALVIIIAHDSLIHWQLACANHHTCSQISVEDRVYTWRKPENGWLKCSNI